MRFTRRPAKAGPIASSTDVRPEVAARDPEIPLLDPAGTGFDVLRGIDIGHAMWRPDTAAELDALGGGDIVIVAAYTADDIESYQPVMQRFMTIVLAMGLGPRHGSRALSLGAVSYIDASMDHGDIQGAFGDAFARIHTRRVRELVA